MSEHRVSNNGFSLLFVYLLSFATTNLREKQTDHFSFCIGVLQENIYHLGDGKYTSNRRNLMKIEIVGSLVERMQFFLCITSYHCVNNAIEMLE